MRISNTKDHRLIPESDLDRRIIRAIVFADESIAGLEIYDWHYTGEVDADGYICATTKGWDHRVKHIKVSVSIRSNGYPNVIYRVEGPPRLALSNSRAVDRVLGVKPNQ